MSARMVANMVNKIRKRREKIEDYIVYIGVTSGALFTGWITEINLADNCLTIVTDCAGETAISIEHICYISIGEKTDG